MRAIGKSDKYQKFFATLDSVSLKLFDEDSGTTKTMESEYNLEDVQGIEPVPQSAYFSVSLGGKSSVKFQAPSNAESADWQKEIGALTVARRRLYVMTSACHAPKCSAHQTHLRYVDSVIGGQCCQCACVSVHACACMSVRWFQGVGCCF